MQADHTVTVEIPAGVDDGTRLRLTGRGGVGETSSRPGDLYVQIRVRPHERFQRRGDDLLHAHVIGMAEAALGTKIDLELLDEEMYPIDVPPGTQPGTLFRIPKQGMPRLRRRGRGDLIVELVVEVPEKLSPDEEEALRRFAELRGERPGKRRRRRKR